MWERLGLRLRFALFFAAFALGGTLIVGAALWFAHGRYGGPAEGYVVAGAAISFGLIGLAAWIGLLFDENVARPILALASDLNTRARSSVETGIDQAPGALPWGPGACRQCAACRAGRGARQPGTRRCLGNRPDRA